MNCFNNLLGKFHSVNYELMISSYSPVVTLFMLNIKSRFGFLSVCVMLDGILDVETND